MQNVNKQLGNGSIIHRCSYYKHILVINKVQTYSSDGGELYSFNNHLGTVYFDNKYISYTMSVPRVLCRAKRNRHWWNRERVNTTKMSYLFAYLSVN
jgi:hypothetical protein